MAVKTASNSGKRRSPGKPFVKGDERINRKGRPKVPKNLLELRDYIDEILDEKLVLDNGTRVERLKAVLRIMTTSRFPQDRKTLLEFRYGKAPQTIDITSGGQPIAPNVLVYLPDNKREDKKT